MKFIAKIGSPESEVSLLETVPTTDKLVEARDVFEAHKKAFLDCCEGQEVLTITDTNKNTLYTLRDGFAKH